MKISCADQSIEVQQWVYAKELQAYLDNSCPLGFLLLGEESERPERFHSVIYHLDRMRRKHFGAGIMSDWHGLQPEVRVWLPGKLLLFGYNERVVGVDVPKCELTINVELGSLFYSFVSIDMPDAVLVSSELGFHLLRSTGEISWEFLEDVVESYDIDAGYLNIKFMDAGHARVRLSNGHVSR